LCVLSCSRRDLDRHGRGVRFSSSSSRTKGPTHTFMGDDDSLLFRADENSQSGSSFPESGTSLQSVVSHHVTHATHAVIGKEDSEGISHCEHSPSSRLSSLRALCVPARRDTHKIPQRRRFKSRRQRQATPHPNATTGRPRRGISLSDG
jgi:hypothetical protein